MSSMAGSSFDRLVEAGVHHLGGGSERAGLVLRLAPFVLRNRIGDDPGGGLHVEPAILHYAGANGDGEIEVAVEAEVTRRARVDAALLGLELVDDLHRAHLGRARDRAR